MATPKEIIFSTLLIAFIFLYNILSGTVGSYYAHTEGNANNSFNGLTYLEIEVTAKVTAGKSSDISFSTSNMSLLRLPNSGNTSHYCQNIIKHHLVCNLVIGVLPRPPTGQPFFKKSIKTA